MLDVQVTAADAGEGNSHDGILGIKYLRLWLIQKFESSFLYVYAFILCYAIINMSESEATAIFISLILYYFPP